jgi:hypothetical protein
MKSVAGLLLAGMALGSLGTLGALRVTSGVTSGLTPHEPFTVTLYRFELQPDKLARFDDWVAFEHAHHAETIATLEREKMYAEAIFRDHEHQPDVIYWLTINGKGEHTDTSPLDIDKQYLSFMRETLKPGARRTLATEYALVPDFIVRAIDEHEQRR